jgi:hypothetical protein
MPGSLSEIWQGQLLNRVEERMMRFLPARQQSCLSSERAGRAGRLRGSAPLYASSEIKCSTRDIVRQPSASTRVCDVVQEMTSIEEIHFGTQKLLCGS